MDSVFLTPRVFAGQARKRTRDIYDDDDDDGDVLLLDEHRFDKKPRGIEIDGLSPLSKELPASLPLRLTNGELNKSFDTSLFTITPPESDESASSSPANERSSSTYSPICSVDVDMADLTTNTHNAPATTTMFTSSDLHAMHPPARPVTRPARLNPESLNYNPSGGRLPTPIHGHFQNSQQAPQGQELEQHPLQQADFQPPTNSMRPNRHNFSFKRPSNIKIRVPPGAYALQAPSSHMLPSPISEGDPDALAGGRLARLSVVGDDAMDVESEEAGKSVASSAMRVDESTRDNATVQKTSVQLFSPAKADRSATTHSTHERRRSLTIPSDKKRFCMGYRDDCEKCRLRVPGHFSHFLP